jgi:hypothetical protein
VFSFFVKSFRFRYSLFHHPLKRTMKLSNTVIVASVVVVVVCTTTAAAALELTPDNFDDATAGKTVFIKYQAPW